MLIENIINGEDIEISIDFQSFVARSTTTNKTGTLYEFTIEVSDEVYVARVMHYDEDTEDEIVYSSVEVLTQASNDPNALPVYQNVLQFIDMKEEEFKEKVCEYARELIENL